MRTSLLLLCVASSALADPRAPMKNGVYPDHQKAWDAFAIQGIKLGLPLEKQAGFTCGPPPGTDGFTTQNHSCVKFLDERCKGRKTKIHHIRVAADLPKGQTCFMDEFNGGTYLDREHKAPPLFALRITGTDTSNPLIFEIRYTFAADDLTSDSRLGRALIAKYGQPTYANPPTQMMWERGDTRLSAACRGIGGDHADQGEFCEIIVEDRKLDQIERSIQDDANTAARAHAAPPPPSL